MVWAMYRHTLMHNDEMASASYLGRRVAWVVGIDAGHASKKGWLQVDLAQLFADLVAFLEREVSKTTARPAHVWVRESFRFRRKANRGTKLEMLRIGVKQG